MQTNYAQEVFPPIPARHGTPLENRPGRQSGRAGRSPERLVRKLLASLLLALVLEDGADAPESVQASQHAGEEHHNTEEPDRRLRHRAPRLDVAEKQEDRCEPTENGAKGQAGGDHEPADLPLILRVLRAVL